MQCILLQVGGQSERWILYHHIHLVERCIRSMKPAATPGAATHPLAPHAGTAGVLRACLPAALYCAAAGTVAPAAILQLCVLWHAVLQDGLPHFPYFCFTCTRHCFCCRVGCAPHAPRRVLPARALHPCRPPGTGPPGSCSGDGAAGAGALPPAPARHQSVCQGTGCKQGGLLTLDSHATHFIHCRGAPLKHSSAC
jgi:hypothetical protein